MKKALLVLGAGVDQMFMINTAHKMSIETIAVDSNPKALGLKAATYSAPIDFSNTKEVIAYVNNLKNQGVPIQGVSTMGSDIPHLISIIANYFDWVGPSEKTAKLATHKYEMKRCFKRNGVPVPNYALVKSSEEIKQYWSKWQCERLIVKPTDRAGSRGVRLISESSQIDEALQYAQKFSRNQQIILEEFVNGQQISTESIVYDNHFVTPGFVDRVYEDMESFHPNIMENGGWLPSKIGQDTRNSILKLVEDSVKALGIDKGVAKGDVVICPDRGPMMIEMAARLSGGDFSESLVPLGTGVNYVETAIEIAMGQKPNFNRLKPQKNEVVANRYFFPPPGKLEEITGIEKCKHLDQLVKLEFFYTPGQTIPRMTNHSQRAGVFIVVKKGKDEAQKIIDYIYDSIKFRINGENQSGDPNYYKY